LYTVLEHTSLELRDDAVTDGNRREEILANARVTEEEYFISPPGNIELNQSEQRTFYDEKTDKK
jgi:aspartyl-tRNA(Asn)/glutamyl-tRNA(Gln) amidotransferase subunit C